MPEHTYWSRTLGQPLSRRSVFRAGGLAGAGLAGAALIGCGEDAAPTAPRATPRPGDPTPAPTPAAADDAPRPGGTLTRFTSTMPTENFNPYVNAGEGTSLSPHFVYDRPFITLLEDPGYELYAAESVEIPDDLTAIIRLKPGLVYQDKAPVNGRPVMSEDIAVLQEYLFGEEAAAEATFQRVFLDHTETPDDRTIIFHLKQPNGYLLSGTHLGGGATTMIPRELVEGDLLTMEPVGSGPYMLDSYQFQVRYEYVRNPTWREADDGLPYIERRVRMPLLDSTAIETGFRGQQAHVMGSGDDRTSVPADMADRLVRDLGDQIEVTEYTALNLNTWNMASSRDYFNDIRVREAFYRNFDQEQFIELVADGWGVVTTGKVSQGLEPYVLDASETAEFRRFDRQEARQLLDAAGWDFDRVYINSTLANPINISGTQVFSEQLRQIGIQTRVDSRPGAEWLQEVSRTGNYDFCGAVGHPPNDSPARQIRLHHTDTQTHHQAFNIRDPEIDAMIEEAERTVDREANIELIKETQLELFRRYSHMSYHYTPILRELRWSFVRDWEFSATNAVRFRTAAWLDV